MHRNNIKDIEYKSVISISAYRKITSTQVILNLIKESNNVIIKFTLLAYFKNKIEMQILLP